LLKGDTVAPSEESISEKPDDVPYVELSNNYFRLEPEEVKFIGYKLIVPEDVKKGVYRGVVSAYSPDLKKIEQNGVELKMAIGVPIEVTVGENLPDRQYDVLSDQANDVAKKYLFVRTLYVLSGIFAIGTLYFLIMAFKYDRKEKPVTKVPVKKKNK
jgi:hypothetical protein